MLCGGRLKWSEFIRGGDNRRFWSNKFGPIVLILSFITFIYLITTSDFKTKRSSNEDIIDKYSSSSILENVIKKFEDDSLGDYLIDKHIADLELKSEHFYEEINADELCPDGYIFIALPGNNMGDSVWEYLSLKSLQSTLNKEKDIISVYLSTKSSDKLNLLFETLVFIELLN